MVKQFTRIQEYLQHPRNQRGNQSKKVVTNDGGFQIDKDGPGYVFASSGLGEKGGEGIVSSLFVGRHGAIGLDSMFQTVEFPASITDLQLIQ